MRPAPPPPPLAREPPPLKMAAPRSREGTASAFRLLDLPFVLRRAIGGYAAVTKRVVQLRRCHLPIRMIESDLPIHMVLYHDDHVSVHFSIDDWEGYLTLLKYLPGICYIKVHKLPVVTAFKKYAPPAHLRIRLTRGYSKQEEKARERELQMYNLYVHAAPFNAGEPCGREFIFLLTGDGAPGGPVKFLNSSTNYEV